MNKIKYILLSVAFLICFSSLFICFDCITKGITKGMYLCVNIVIPSLFPVLCLCSVFIKTDFTEKLARRCESLSKILLHQNGYALPVFLLSIVSGYPVGAIMAQSLCTKNCITVSQRDRLVLTCCGAGPAFVVLAVGVGMLGSYEKGVILLVSHMLSSIATAFFVSRFFKTDYKNENVKFSGEKCSLADALVEGVSSATSSTINICAFTILFSGVICVLSVYLRNTPFFVPISGLLEVSNGCYVVSGQGVSLPTISAIIGFGGLSVICQIVSATKGKKVNFLKIVAVRLLHAVNSYFITTVILCFYKIETPVMKTTDTSFIVSEKNIYFSAMLIILCVVFIGTLCKKSSKNLLEFFKM